MIDISYGILNYNPKKDEASTCAYIAAVDALFRNRSDDLSSEVYLIDQFSQPELTQELAESYGFRALLLERNVGISRGINLLARMARGQYISLVTSDTIFDPGLDTALITALEKDDDIWQICPASDNASSDYQKRGYKNGGLAFQLAQELTIHFWPRTTFDNIGYFDERWKACYENVDFALRIYLSEGRVAVSHDAFCHHDLGTSIKNGSINNVYDGYIYMKDGFNHEPLKKMWQDKWPGFQWQMLYEDLSNRTVIYDGRWNHNLYLPYLQNVAY